MTIAMPLPVDADPLLYPLIAQLFDKHGFARVDDGDPHGLTQRPGRTLVLFLEDPVRYRETLDLAVIVPKLARTFPGRFAVVVALAATARKLAVRYGFRKWPAFVMLADGRYVGAVDGLRNWAEYVEEVARLLDAPAARAPTIGVPVQGAGGDGADNCHA
jgi:hydrogenase-1 operon protein HyaE